MATEFVREIAGGGFVLHPKLFELLVDLTDEDSRPVVDVFWYVEGGSVDGDGSPAEHARIVREWLGYVVQRGWITTVDPSYPVTIEARVEDIDAWVVRHGEDYAGGRVPYADVRCPEISGTPALKALLAAEALVPVERARELG
jgi:hypothetical protein